MPASRGPKAEAHPALGVLRQRRITNRRVAELLGLSPAWVGSVLLGQVRVPTSFSEGLAALLDLPPAALFREDPPTHRYPGDAAIGDIVNGAR